MSRLLSYVIAGLIALAILLVAPAWADALLTRGHLTTDLGRNLDLAAVVLLAVGMAAIDHQAFFQAGCGQRLGRRRHTLGIIVGALATTQNDVTVRVALGLDRGHLTILVNRQKVVLLPRREDGVDGDRFFGRARRQRVATGHVEHFGLTRDARRAAERGRQRVLESGCHNDSLVQRVLRSLDVVPAMD